VQIFLAYQQDLVRAMDVVRSAVENTAGVLGEPPIAVRIGQLQENSAMLETQFWADSRRSDYAATTAAVRAAIIESCKKAGIALPDGNARTLEPGDPAAWQEAFGDGRIAPTRRVG
jgi:small-conductance mechanosensitive channel